MSRRGKPSDGYRAEAEHNDVLRALAAVRRDPTITVSPPDVDLPDLRFLAEVLGEDPTAAAETVVGRCVALGADREAAERMVGDCLDFTAFDVAEGRAAAERVRSAGAFRRLDREFRQALQGFDLDDADDRGRLTAILERANGVDARRTDACTRLSELEPRLVRFLWPGRIALGAITILGGDGGLGKSMISLDWAARATTGDAWPDGRPNPLGPCDALLVSCEDDLADTVLPRAIAAGADRARLISMRLDSLHDVRAISRVLGRHPAARLVVVDPISAHVGSIDSHKASEVRSMLRPLAELARARDVAMLLIAHVNKAVGMKAQHRVEGSTSFVNAARAAYVVAPSKEDRLRRLVLPLKNNLGADEAGLAFRIETVPLTIEGSSVEVPRVAWESAPVSASADDVLGEGTGGSKLDEACEFLREALADGAMSQSDLRSAAQDAGIAWGTLIRAKAKVGGTSEKDGGGPWRWSLAAAPAVRGERDAAR